MVFGDQPIHSVVSTSAQRELVLLTHDRLFWGSLGGSVASQHTRACVRARVVDIRGVVLGSWG